MTPTARRAQLEFIFNGAAVLRYHTTPPIRPQTDGAHSFGVAWLVWMLTEGTCSRELILAALAHDLAEHQTGDLSAMAKRFGDIGTQLDQLEKAHLATVGLDFSLSPEEQNVLQLADKIEGMMFCISERRLGNQDAELWFNRYASYPAQLPAAGVAKELLVIIFEMWEEVCPNTIALTYGR